MRGNNSKLLKISIITTFLLLNIFLYRDIFSNGVSGEKNPLLVSDKQVFSQTKITTPQKILRIGEIARPLNYDPLTITTGANYKRISLLYNSLLEYDPTSGEVKLALATQMTVTTDSKCWIFDLREDVTFHDGSKFKASSVKFSFDRMINPSLPGYHPLEHFPLESVEIITEFRVKIILKEGYAPFSNLDAIYLKIISPNSFNETGHFDRPIGTGPYMLDLATSNENFQNFTRFANHYKGLPPFEQIHYYNFGESPPYLWETYEDNITNHDLDFVSSIFLKDLQSDLPEELFSDEYWELIIQEEINIQGILYINHRMEELSVSNVRKALNYAINQSEFEDIYFSGTTTPMKSFFPPGVPFANDSIPGYPYNVALANELLDAAGYPKGSDGYRFELEMLGTSISEASLVRVGDFFDVVGIKTTILTPVDVWTRFNNGEYDLVVIGKGVGFDPDFLWDYIHPDSVQNTGGYSNEIVTNLIELGRQTPIKQEREYYYNKIQWLLQEDAPYIYLTDRKVFYAASTSTNPYISLNKLGEFVFQYSEEVANPKLRLLYYQEEEITDLSITKNVVLTEIPTYCPSTDSVVTAKDQENNAVTVKMTYNLDDLVTTQNLMGKFYEIIPETSEAEYIFRSYYDKWEIESITTSGLNLWKWDNGTSEWVELTPVSSNSSFRYVEVNLSGHSILKLDKKVKTNQTPSFDISLVILVLSVSIIWRRRKESFLK